MSVLVLIGVTIGLAASIGAGNALSNMRLLFRVSPYDAISLGVAVTGMIGVALFASYIPARRASRVDPSIALRSE
jgi:ABC-type antimicrobial peptide transport system permease subunit